MKLLNGGETSAAPKLKVTYTPMLMSIYASVVYAVQFFSLEIFDTEIVQQHFAGLTL